jgi:hypothetical protein
MNFLYVKPETLAPDLCARFIELFEQKSHLHLLGQTAQSCDPKHKADTEIRIDPTLLSDPEWVKPLAMLFVALATAIEEYKTQSRGLNLIAPWTLSAPFNMQRYLPGEGYPTLHCEVDAGTDVCLRRVLTWILYLNTVTDQGGTFFPNQETTVTAEQGKLLISPAYWTHSHQGIVSPTQTKYILTGWYQFC